MKLFKNSLATLLIGLFIVGLTTNVNAQDKREATQTYNKALDLMNAQDFEQAADMFEKAISEAGELGAEGQDIVDRSKKQMPTVYWGMAKKEYANFQSTKSLSSLDATVQAFQKAGEVADQYGNSQIAGKVPGIITQLTYTKSLVQYQKQNYQSALSTLDELIAENPKYAKAYYQKGIVSKKVEGNGLDKTLGFFKKAIEVGNATNNSEIVSKAKNAAASELTYRGSQAVENKDYSNALNLLNQALEYDDSSEDAYYRMAEAYNGQQKWQKAVNASQKALELSNGGRSDKAKIYFTLGTARQGLGSRADACSAFDNAAYGTFKSSAEHKMEFELKCSKL